MAPRPPGFWCARYQSKPAVNDAIHTCFLTEKTCNTLRTQGIDNGAQIAPCQAQDAAYCFTMADRVDQKVYWRCYHLADQCRTERQSITASRPDLELGECKLSRVPASTAQSSP